MTTTSSTTTSFYCNEDPIPSFIDQNGQTLYLIAGESHGLNLAHERASASPWSHSRPKNTNFSENIVVVAITAGLHASAILVKKINPDLPETIRWISPDREECTITF